MFSVEFDEATSRVQPQLGHEKQVRVACSGMHYSARELPDRSVFSWGPGSKARGTVPRSVLFCSLTLSLDDLRRHLTRTSIFPGSILESHLSPSPSPFLFLSFLCLRSVYDRITSGVEKEGSGGSREEKSVAGQKMYKYRFYRFVGIGIEGEGRGIGFSVVGNGGRNREPYFEGFACFRGFHGTSVYQLFIVDYTRLRRRFSRQRRFASAGELIYCRENCYGCYVRTVF